MKSSYAMLALALLAYSCKTRSHNEGAASDSNVLATSNPGPLPLNRDAAELKEYLDIRGVGDSAAASDRVPPRKFNQVIDGLHPERDADGNPAYVANFGRWLDYLDSSHTLYKGDLSFINFETVITKNCQFTGGDFNFAMHPDNIWPTVKRGFNLIGLANNHARDCVDGGKHTAWAMNRIQKDTWDYDEENIPEKYQPTEPLKILWHGAHETPEGIPPKVGTFQVKGRDVTVAFASIYVRGPVDAYSVTAANAERVLKGFGEGAAKAAKVKILAIHTLEFGQADFDEVRYFASRFVKEFDGDVVFGHGPHVWQTVDILRKPSGAPAVFFQSLGNFIHPGLSNVTRNFIGRALLERTANDDYVVKQVQAIPVHTYGAMAKFGGASYVENLPTNQSWKTVQGQPWLGAWKSGQAAVEHRGDPAPVGGWFNVTR